VLLLEAGPDRRAQPPEGFRDGWGLPQEFDWGYVSEPKPDGEVQRCRRIKLLGGTSWLTRFAPRGSPADYDGWAARGCTGWGFDDVLPYFLRLETDDDFGDQAWHGDSGPMPVKRYFEVEYTEPAAAALSAMLAAGFPPVDDHNRPGAVGAGRMPMSSREGERVTTADAYLPPGGAPANLTIRPDTQVAQVTCDGDRATGVQLLDGAVVEAGWVVLCAGTFGSPLLLLRSGIGPAEHLRELGIPVRIDLPGVGANLTDHTGVEFDMGYREPSREAPGLHLMTSFHSSMVGSDEPPDMLLWTYDPVVAPGEPPAFVMEVLLMRPRSRGSVRLRSADPAEPPSITVPSLGDPLDVDRLREAYRRALEVGNSPEIRRLCAGPAPAAPDGDLGEWIRTNFYSYPHVVGTCAMGPRPEEGAVVGLGGRVHGTDGLSVVDASIMPDIPSGFTHFPTIMIAERLSEQLVAAV